MKHRPAACKWARIAAAAMLGTLLLVHATAFAQDEEEGQIKIPSKIGNIKGGNDKQAFTGKVQSVDAKLHVLNMVPEEGKGSELFSVKKNVEIRTAHGDRISLESLKPGSDVVIYYEMKETQRVVKRIIELSPRKGAAKKNSPS